MHLLSCIFEGQIVIISHYFSGKQVLNVNGRYNKPVYTCIHI